MMMADILKNTTEMEEISQNWSEALKYFTYAHENTPPYSPTDFIKDDSHGSNTSEKRTYQEIDDSDDSVLERPQKQQKFTDIHQNFAQSLAQSLNLDFMEGQKTALESPHLVMPSFPETPLTSRRLALILQSQIMVMEMGANLNNRWVQEPVTEMDEQTASMALESPHLIMQSFPQTPLNPQNLSSILYEQMLWTKQIFDL